jgi:hypothetical protein
MQEIFFLQIEEKMHIVSSFQGRQKLGEGDKQSNKNGHLHREPNILAIFRAAKKNSRMSCLVRLEKQCCFHRDYHFCPVFAAD